MTFAKEADFEAALINMLANHGWEKNVLRYPTQKDLVKNWADILFQNNRDKDRLDEYPLTDGEMNQILEQITALKTPLKLNGFINGKSVTIKRDNEQDTLHFGKEVSLHIYDRQEISAGRSRYQIVQQPQFPSSSKIHKDRRGDLMLLINGMPVIHIELKKSGISVTQASKQIEKYAAEGVFTGIFSLVQIFVAMNPEETVYFANPGPEGKFHQNFFFHWANFDNERINKWKEIASTLLSIPMAHQLIGFYTIADESDGVLKVMRSYQIYAATKISDKVAETKWDKWDKGQQRGGFIWHTTGSGKTMTSFKSAQLIALSKDADKVIFLIDRIELGTQSIHEYRSFANPNEEVQATEDTRDLIAKLISKNFYDTLIVTSIQKMSKLKDKDDSGYALTNRELVQIQSKRIVIIVDECHRSVFGESMIQIKRTFPKAIFFGFSGTPIQDENQKNGSNTATIFGNELHRYSIADGIQDENVLGFDPCRVSTYDYNELREKIALHQAKASTVQEAIADPQKRKTYYQYMQMPIAGSYTNAGDYIKGIEDYIPDSQYTREEHRKMVVKDIRDNWTRLSRDGQFHAIFATASIKEAIQYYKLIKDDFPSLKVTAMFDSNDSDNADDVISKNAGLEEIITDYNERYVQKFTSATFHKMKQDISARLAHKKPYERIDQTPAQQIDLLIVVRQMLTGFDSKWINTLYVDKVMQNEEIIQAFSRTNRIFGSDKPFGTIHYYRRPYTMERLIDEAFKLYSGDRPFGLFAEKLDKNLEQMNDLFAQIKDLFEQAGIENFTSMPQDIDERKQFTKLFKAFNDHLNKAKIQGFVWGEGIYPFKDDEGNEEKQIEVTFDEVTYKILAQRYKELFNSRNRDGTESTEEVPYDIDGYLIAIDTAKIDVDYMNSRFTKYLKLKQQEGADSEALKQAEEQLHKTFAYLSQEEQKFANIFLHDIQSGDVEIEEGMTFRDYITKYMSNAKSDQVHSIAEVLGIDEDKLRTIMADHVTKENLNKYGRFEELKKTVNKKKAKAYFEAIEGHPIAKITAKANNLLSDFILQGGFAINLPPSDA